MNPCIEAIHFGYLWGFEFFLELENRWIFLIHFVESFWGKFTTVSYS